MLLCALTLLAVLAFAPDAFANFFTPQSGGSPNANRIANLYSVTLYIAAVVFVGVEGTLLQDLPSLYGHSEHCRVPGNFDSADHPVHLAAGSQAAKAAGAEHTGSLSHHHQGIGRLGEDLVVTGWSDLDELPEAIEVPDKRFALGVQWHPEADATSQVIASLVEEAREYALARAA